MGDYLIHHGILGQKWGVRRYQNEDGSLTAAGRKRYGVNFRNMTEEIDYSKKTAKRASRMLNDYGRDVAESRAAAYRKEKQQQRAEKSLNAERSEKYRNQAKSLRKQAEAGEENIKHLVEYLENEGFTVSSKDVTYDVSRAYYGPQLNSLRKFGGLPVYMLTAKYEVGQKYKVGTYKDLLQTVNTRKKERYD